MRREPKDVKIGEIYVYKNTHIVYMIEDVDVDNNIIYLRLISGDSEFLSKDRKGLYPISYLNNSFIKAIKKEPIKFNL